MDRQTITVDIAPEGYADHRLKVSQYDIGRPLGVYIQQHGADLGCAGYTAQLYLYKPDRTNIEKPCVITGNLIAWDTAEQETIVAGICVAEIRIRDGSQNVGTANFTIWVEESPADTSGSSHSESQSLIDMVDRAEDAAETAESSAAIAAHAKDETVAAAEAVERFDQMTAEAETLAPGSEATAEMDYTGEHPVMKFGIPAGATGATGPEGRQGQQGQQGEPGDDGFSPTASVTDITGGHRVTITDAEGDHSFDVMDGQGGSGGAVSSVNGETGDVVLDGTKVNVNNSAQTPVTVADELGNLNRALNDKYQKPATGIPASDLANGVIPTVPVQDVQVDGASVVTDGVAEIPILPRDAIKASGESGVGLVPIKNGYRYGFDVIDDNNGIYWLKLMSAPEWGVKARMSQNSNGYGVIDTYNAFIAVFYGLARAAGADMNVLQSATVGIYPEAQKSAISQMLNAPETVSGTTPSITAKAGVRYICGEVSTLTIVVPATGIIDVTFDSGSTPTVLTVTPPSGMTMRWIGEDPTALEANKHYEINIMDGCNGMVVSWT